MTKEDVFMTLLRTIIRLIANIQSLRSYIQHRKTFTELSDGTTTHFVTMCQCQSNSRQRRLEDTFTKKEHYYASQLTSLNEERLGQHTFPNFVICDVRF